MDFDVGQLLAIRKAITKLIPPKAQTYSELSHISKTINRAL